MKSRDKSGEECAQDEVLYLEFFLEAHTVFNSDVLAVVRDGLVATLYI